MSDKKGVHGVWIGRWTFVLAAAGSAVGLGNLWKFPYIMGENGGSAFVLMYLACILFVGLPVMMAEVVVGRKGRMSPINSMRSAIQESGASKLYHLVGPMGALAGFLILSFYSVVAGWTLYYVVLMAKGTFVGANGELAGSTFGGLLSDPALLMGLHTAFIVLVGFVVARGVNKGFESASRILMPLLFAVLIGLFGYSLSTSGFNQAFHFMFDFDFSKLNSESLLVALGHSFFTLSLGLGSIMVYGAYMPKESSIGRTVLSVAALDTLVALMAGLVIFSVVFTNNLEPGAGPGLMFQTLPVAFGGLAGGDWLGALFFLLVAVAAWTSAISLAEPAVSWVVERGASRTVATSIVCALAWIVGIGTVLSFNEWADYKLWDKNFFDALDFLTTNIMLPLGGLLVVVFVGWGMKATAIAKEVRPKNMLVYNLWRVASRFIAPLAVLYVFINGII